MIEHWLLELAVEYPVWLTQLFPIVDDVGLNVKPVPGASGEDYARALIHLYDSGPIAFSSEVPGDDVQTTTGVRRIVGRFLKLPQEVPMQPLYKRNRVPGMEASFELTSRGGEKWETLAQPDWKRIITVSADLESAEVFSPNRDLLATYVEAEGIAPGDIAWQTHRNFEILYWKRLPLVYQASFRLQRDAAVKLWAVRWHKKPWELPGWPRS